MNRWNLLASWMALAGAAGCFNPQIPSGAFFCAAPTRLCPEGQKCIQGVCVSSAIQPDGLPPPADMGRRPDGAVPKGALRLDGSTPGDAAGCADAALEPNNSLATATPLGDATERSGLAICYPGDVDTFLVRVPAGLRLRVTVHFTNADGDLDAALLDPDGHTIDESKGYGDDEVVETVSAVSRTANYAVGVKGFLDAVNTYSLQIDRM
jgi:hypothetical protein